MFGCICFSQTADHINKIVPMCLTVDLKVTFLTECILWLIATWYGLGLWLASFCLRPQIRLLFKITTSKKSYHTIINPIEAAMFLQRSAFAAARRAAVSPIVKRSFTSSFMRSTTPSSWFSFHETNWYYRRCSTNPIWSCWEEDEDIRRYEDI